MIRAILFDFDGVLVESVDIKTKAFAKIFENESPETIQKIVEYHIENKGVSRFEKFRYIYKEILKRPLSDSNFQRLCDRFSTLVMEEVINAPYVSGAKEFLERNYKSSDLYVISSTPEEELKRIIAKRGMSKYFRAIIGAPLKKGEIALNILRGGKYKPEEVLLIGDSIADYKAAKGAHIAFVGRVTEKDNPFAGFPIMVVRDMKSLPRCRVQDLLSNLLKHPLSAF